MHDFKKLTVWNMAIELVTDIYKTTEAFLKTEIYGITNQMRRCAVSIPATIAEGAGRKTQGEFKLFLGYAYGSCCELETQLIISNKLNYLNQETLNLLSRKLNEIEKMIFKLTSSIKN